MFHAHFMNIAEAGTYSKVLNETLKTNNFPTIKVPDNPPSPKLISATKRQQDKKEKETKNKEEITEVIGGSVDETEENLKSMDESEVEIKVTETTKIN